MTKQLQAEVEVQASPERVWEVLTDFAAYPDWNPFIVQAGGRAAPGSRLELRMRLPGRGPAAAGGGGTAALTMRRLAERLGIRAPSLYKHLPDKAALEAAIIATGLEEAAAAFETAVGGTAQPLPALAAAY